MNFIQTYSGHTLDYENPQADQIDIEDIAHHLTLLNRFTGATVKPYTVAEHCIYCSYRAKPEYAFALLMHDAHEAYIGDINTPLKRYMVSLPLARLDLKLRMMIWEKFGLQHFDSNMSAEILEVDRRTLFTEKRDLLKVQIDWEWVMEPYADRIEPIMDYWTIKRKFLDRFEELKRANQVQ